MTDDDRADLTTAFGLLWEYAWIYAGTQDHRRILLEIKARIDAQLNPPIVPPGAPSSARNALT